MKTSKHTTTPAAVTSPKRLKLGRWSQERVLAEARRRTKELFTANSVAVQRMLADLLVEAGWEEDDFVDALCKDVIQNGRPFARG